MGEIIKLQSCPESIFCVKLARNREFSLWLQNPLQIPDLSLFTGSGVFFCGGALESDDSFLL